MVGGDVHPLPHNSPKAWLEKRISVINEASDFKFVIQLGFAGSSSNPTRRKGGVALG